MAKHVWLIDDSDDLGDIMQEKVREVYPDAEIQEFDDVMEACRATGSPDYIVVDMSAVSPIHLGPAAAYSLVARLGQHKPGAVIVIASGVPAQFVDEVVERVREVGCDAVIRRASLCANFDLRDVLQ